MLTICALLLVAACGEPRVMPTLVDQRVAQGDAQLFVHVRITADGRIVLRNAAVGRARTWLAQTDYPFTMDDPEGSMQAIKRLHRSIVDPWTAEQEAAPSADRRGPSAVVIIDAHPMSLWRRTAWVIATASSPQATVQRICFLGVGPDRWLDIELPCGAEGHPSDPSLRMVTVLTAKLFRNGLDLPAEEHFTLVRWERTQQEVTPTLDPRVPDRDRANSERVLPDSMDLPREAESPEVHAVAWRRLEERVATLVEGRSPWIGELRTPWPKGPMVPYAHVAQVLEIFQRQGCGRIWLECEPPPVLRKDGGGEFHSGR